MERKIGKSQKCCATCANWSGPRSANSFGDAVIVPMSGGYLPNAKCFSNPTVGGFAYGPKADYCCPKYAKWSGLK